MKGKRGTDHTWSLIKYLGDGAVYAKCKCGYHYHCGILPRDPDWFIDIPSLFLPYCPSCGARKKNHTAEIEKSSKMIEEVKTGGTVYSMYEHFYKIYADKYKEKVNDTR